MINAIALIIKGALIGGLGGLLVPATWMALVFGLGPFLQQFADNQSIFVILTSLISIPFSILFQGLLEGGLILTTIFGAASGAAVAILVLVLQRFSKRVATVVVGILALIVAVVIGLTQSAQITLALGLTGVQIWVLLALYAVCFAALAFKLREPSVA